jgi:hypothetical protein
MTRANDMTEGGDNLEKVARFKAALDQLIERIAEDRYVLAVVLVGSLSPTTVWRRESLGLWIIEADGVSRRLPSDGNDERVFRILVENGINIHAEIIPRSRFKQMVEGASRTAFSSSFFAERQIVYSKDPSIENVAAHSVRRGRRSELLRLALRKGWKVIGILVWDAVNRRGWAWHCRGWFGRVVATSFSSAAW